MPLNPQETFIHLAQDGRATELPGGEAFWALPPTELERHGHGWLLTELAFASDWPSWERHPQADEFVYLLSGSVELLLDQPEGVRSIRLQDCGALIIPKGVWHTARVHAPSRMLFVTLGAGTQTRPV